MSTLLLFRSQALSAWTFAYPGKVCNLWCSGDLWDESEIRDKNIGDLKLEVQKLLSVEEQQNQVILDEYSSQKQIKKH